MLEQADLTFDMFVYLLTRSIYLQKKLQIWLSNLTMLLAVRESHMVDHECLSVEISGKIHTDFSASVSIHYICTICEEHIC